MTLAANTKVHELLKTHPFLEDFLASYNAKFEMLKNRMARATVGRVATGRGCGGADVSTSSSSTRSVRSRFHICLTLRPHSSVPVRARDSSPDSSKCACVAPRRGSILMLPLSVAPSAT